MPATTTKTIVVIGAGIVGAATAYFLVQRGFAVRLVDAVAPAAAATGAADGAVSVASKRPGPMMTAAMVGIELYRSLQRDGLLADSFKTRSAFIIATRDDEADLLGRHADALVSGGVRVDRLERDVLARRMPVLSSDARLALEVHGEGHAIGYQIVHRLLAAVGITVERATRIEALLPTANGASLRGVQTSNGVIEADAVIVAAGTGSAELLGLEGVLFPRKGQLLVTERAANLNAALAGAIMSARYLVSKAQVPGKAGGGPGGIALVIDPLRTGQFLIGGTREDFGDCNTNDIASVSHILADAVALIPELARVRLLRSFAGSRTAVVDGLPLIGRIPSFDNGFIATGFEGDGICLGPVAALALTRLIAGEKPPFDLAPFDPSRFLAHKTAA